MILDSEKIVLELVLAGALVKEFLDVAVDDLNTAITLLLEAVESKPKDVSVYSRCLFEASTALRMRFCIKADPQDLKMMSKLSEIGLSLSPEDAYHNGHCETRCVTLLEVFSRLKCKSRVTLQLALRTYSELVRPSLARCEETVSQS